MNGRGKIERRTLIINEEKAKWEKYYSIVDPYGHDKWYSDKKRRDSTIDLMVSRNLKFGKCLELGCGEGRVTNILSGFCNKIIAVDISINALNTARIINEKNMNVEFIEADMYQIKFPPQEFDLINAIEALDYTKLWDDEIQKWINWLKPGGYIIFSGPNLKGYFTYRDLLKLFKRDELEIIEHKIVTSKFPLQWLINRVPFLKNDILWYSNIYLSSIIPGLLGKHIAFLVKKK